MIVGVDISTHRIDLAWLQDGKPQRWHQELGKGSTIDRIRRIRVQWPRDREVIMPGTEDSPHIILKRGIFDPVQSDVTDVCIEEPWGRGKALPPLHQVLGIVTRQAPTWARVAHVSSGDLRRAIGAKNTKVAAHDALWGAHELDDWLCRTDEIDTWDEHELDALVACIAWTRILDQQDAA